MRRLALLPLPMLFGLVLFCGPATRADDEQPTPQPSGSDSTSQKPNADAPADAKPDAPKVILVLTPRAARNGAPIARETPFRTLSDDTASADTAWNPAPTFGTSSPIAKRSAKRLKSPQVTRGTLRVLCTKATMSTAAAKKGEDYIIDCSGPVYLHNGITDIRCSKLHFAEGVLTLDDVTIYQPDSPAGLLTEVQAKKLTLKFPLESIRIHQVDEPGAVDHQQDVRPEYDEFDTDQYTDQYPVPTRSVPAR